MRAISKGVQESLLGENQRVVATSTDLTDLRLPVLHFEFIINLVHLSCYHLPFIRHLDLLWLVCFQEISIATLSISATSPSIQLVIIAQHKRVKASRTNLGNSLVSHLLNQLRTFHILVVAMSTLTLVVGLTATSPGVELSFLVQSHRVKISAVNLNYKLA